jgi:hypothetical protein
MIKEIPNILAINPGTKYLGYAVFQGSELRDWGIKTISGKWSKEKMEKLEKIIVGFIDRYGLNILAIKRLHPSRSSQNLDELVSQIKELAKSKGLRICQYSINDLKDFFSPEKRINKNHLAEILTSKHQSLFHELEEEKAHKNHYRLRMFEAVALGSVCSYQLDQ